jgi:hypothetical protein
MSCQHPLKERFISRIQTCYPGADVLCVSFNWPETLGTYVRNAYDAERAAGNQNVHYLHLVPANAGGCDFHPNVGAHRAMAQQLTPVIQGILGMTGTRAGQVHTARAARARVPARVIAGRRPADQGATLFDITGRITHGGPANSAGVMVRVAR